MVTPPAIKRSTKFQPGNKIGPRFTAGRSGNPTGRPKGAPAFRDGCRDTAEMFLGLIRDNPTAKHLDKLVHAMEVLAEHGGYLPVDRLTHAESVRVKTMLDVLACPHLSAAEKVAYVTRNTARELDVLAETQPEVAS